MKKGFPQECLRAAPSASWWTHPKGKEKSRQEEDGNNVRNLIRGHLRCLSELFGGQEADQQGTVHDGSNPVWRRRLTFAATMKSFPITGTLERVSGDPVSAIDAGQ